jgi:hypothetical protein
MTLKNQEEVDFFITVIFIAKQNSFAPNNPEHNQLLLDLLNKFAKVPNFPFMRDKQKKMAAKNIANQALKSAAGALDRKDRSQVKEYVAQGLLDCYQAIQGKEFVAIITDALKVPLTMLQSKKGYSEDEVNFMLPAAGLMARTELAKNGLYVGPLS